MIHDFTLLLHALADSETTFVLGAGASAPQVPTMRQLPSRLAPYAKLITSFSAVPIPDSPLRRLINPLIERSQTAIEMEEFVPGVMSAGFVAVLVEDLIAQAHRRSMPQYEVFHLFSPQASVISFNWDGLAGARCGMQRLVIHPHGAIPPRPLLPNSLAERLDWAQDDDYGHLREIVLPGLVMPGEEDRPEHAATRERVFNEWLIARSIVIVGYSFGIGSSLRYDQAWLDAFVTAMESNKTASIHVVSPDAEELRERLCELLAHRRRINTYSWPVRWGVLSTLLLRRVRDLHSHSVGELIPAGATLAEEYESMALVAS